LLGKKNSNGIRVPFSCYPKVDFEKLLLPALPGEAVKKIVSVSKASFWIATENGVEVTSKYSFFHLP